MFYDLKARSDLSDRLRVVEARLAKLERLHGDQLGDVGDMVSRPAGFVGVGNALEAALRSYTATAARAQEERV